METKYIYRWLLSAAIIACAAAFLFVQVGPTLYAGEHAEPVKKYAYTLTAWDFTLDNLDGKPVSWRDYKDKIVVLEWTNYDCPFVKYHYTPERQTTVELIGKYTDKDVVWLWINSGYEATVDGMKAWADKWTLPYPKVLMDPGGKLGKLYGAKTTPHIYIFGKDGKLVYKGALDNAPMGTHTDPVYINYADRALGEITSGQEVSIIKTRPYGCPVKYEPENGDK